MCLMRAVNVESTQFLVRGRGLRSRLSRPSFFGPATLPMIHALHSAMPWGLVFGGRRVVENSVMGINSPTDLGRPTVSKKWLNPMAHGEQMIWRLQNLALYLFVTFGFLPTVLVSPRQRQWACQHFGKLGRTEAISGPNPLGDLRFGHVSNGISYP